MGPRMQPRNEKFLTSSAGRIERRRARRHSHGVRRRAARALGGLVKRMHDTEHADDGTTPAASL